MSHSPGYSKWMKRALLLARKARGNTGHYPMVGAVIIRGNRKVSEGYFRAPGEPHAEINAIKRAGQKARGSTLVLNLEPCSHYGRTPPCTDAVIRAGIKRVVAGMEDPNPLVSGKGFAALKKAGVEVVSGVIEEECRELNRVFAKFITTRTPFVVMKAAMTLDGKIAAAGGDSKWISGEPARKEAHRMRDQCQAVMVGAGTIRADDSELTARLAGKGRHPRPVIVTSSLDVPLSSKVMSTPAKGGPLIFCTRKAPSGRIKSFRQKGAEVVVVRKERHGGADVEAVMQELGERRIASVLLEGGARLISSALRAGVVDELVLFVAPKLLAGDGLSLASGKGAKKIADAVPVAGMTCKKMGDDLMIVGKPARI